MIIASLGFSFIITTSVQLIWGTQSQSMPAMIANNTIYNIGSVTFNTTQLIVTVIGFVVMALLALLVNKTKLGTSIRAVSQDRDTAELMGINVNKTVSMTFLIGSALAAMSAIMMASYYSTIYPSMGDLIGTKGFAAVVLGGAAASRSHDRRPGYRRHRVPGGRHLLRPGPRGRGLYRADCGAPGQALRYSRKGGRQRMKADFFRSNYKKILVALLFLLWIVCPIMIQNNYITHLIFMATIFAVLAASLNIAVGVTGLSNMSHATFFGIGAYVAAILATNYEAPFYVTLLAGAFVAMAFGLVLGAPTLRLKGFYLSLVTIGFGQIIRIIELNWISVTKGPMGIPGIPAAIPRLLRVQYGCQHLLCLAILGLTLLVTRRLLKSKTGRALSAIKNDEVVARSMGVNVTMYKVIAFALAAFFAGMAGTVYAHYIGFVSPDSFTQADSQQLLCMVILGGSGTLYGPIIGALVLVFTPEILRFADHVPHYLRRRGHGGRHPG